MVYTAPLRRLRIDRRQSHVNRAQGFTLIEVLIVIIIIGILAALVITQIIGAQNQAKTTAGLYLATQVVKKAKIYYTEYGEYPSYEQLMSVDENDPAKISSEMRVMRLRDLPPDVRETLYDPGEYHLTAQIAKDGTVVIWAESVMSYCGVRTGVLAYVVYWSYVDNQQIAVPITDGAPSGKIGDREIDDGFSGSCGG